MPRQITIPSGSTLGGLAKQYGTTTNDLMSLNPDIKDPNKISAGANLNLPELAGTLNTQSAEKKLPETKMDRLSIFQDVLKTVTAKAAQEGKVAGATALPTGMPDASKVSGSSFAGILNLVSQQKTRGISDIYKSTTDMLKDIEDKANKQLDTLISTGAIANLNDDQLGQLADATHNSVDYLKEIRTIKQEKETPTKKTTEEDAMTYTNMVLTGMMDLTGVPTSNGMKAEVGRQLAQVYSNPIAKRIETWKAKKERYIAEGKEQGLTDPGTREDVIRQIKNELPDYTVDEIGSVVYTLIPDTWEYNIARRWKPAISEQVNTSEE